MSTVWLGQKRQRSVAPSATITNLIQSSPGISIRRRFFADIQEPIIGRRGRPAGARCKAGKVSTLARLDAEVMRRQQEQDLGPRPELFARWSSDHGRRDQLVVAQPGKNGV